MKKSLKRKRTKMSILSNHEILEQSVSAFWNIQRQWHGQGPEDVVLTTSQAIKRLGTIIDTHCLPKGFKKSVWTLRQEIICNTRPKTSKASKSQPTCSIISIR